MAANNTIINASCHELPYPAYPLDLVPPMLQAPSTLPTNPLKPAESVSPHPCSDSEPTTTSVFSEDSDSDDEGVFSAANNRSSLILDLRELRRVDSSVMERRVLRRQRSKLASTRRTPLQVVKVRSCGISPDPRLPEWQVAERPAEALNVGDSVFIQLVDDERQRGYAAAFAIVGIPKFPQENTVRLQLMSRAAVHAPIKLTVRAQWFAPSRRPSMVEGIWRVIVRCFSSVE
ncbi:hypothetical protein BDY19DRAFT_990687 [Irpex rosettiformis]|uniref:Uncharacterized protein n=1 Tax=Irpex rosettiformis TaxID=378272 RepID=A0ACB8UCH6_9APHY|nr:hypothetical protein BDY19DRAFT_990687 [Irpex rosettiformis]